MKPYQKKNPLNNAAETMTRKRNHHLQEKLVKILTALFLVTFMITGCDREDRKPELNPVILTSTANATNIRPYTIPEGMTSYMDLDAMREAVETGDAQLEGVDDVFVLSPQPQDLSPSFRAQHGEVRVIYKNSSNDRSFHIYQYPSLDPHLLFDEKALIYDTVAINGEPFYIVDPLIQTVNLEAYTIRDGWLIQLTAMGFSQQEFLATLAELTRESLE